jgi:hypothetical protein
MATASLPLETFAGVFGLAIPTTAVSTRPLSHHDWTVFQGKKQMKYR